MLSCKEGSSADAARDVDRPAGLGPAAPAAASARAQAAQHLSSGWVRLGRLILTGQRFALGVALALLFYDAGVLALTRGGATWAQWAKGMGGAAFVALSTALVLGGMLGPVLVPVAWQVLGWTSAGWAALRRGEVDARHGFVAHALVLPGLLAVWAAAIYHVVIFVMLRFARPETMAATITASAMALTSMLLVVWPSAIRGGRILVDGASRVRGLRWLVERTWPVSAMLVVTGLVVSATVVVVERQRLAALPWTVVPAVVCPIIGLGLAKDLPRVPTWLRGLVLGLTVLVFSAGSLAAMRIRPESSTAQNIGFHRALSGRVGYAVWTLAMDFDGDGQISVLGGGDCAPFDSRRYTGALDVPGDGIDEDCDGIDNVAPQVLTVRPPLQLGANVLSAHPTIILVSVDALAAPELSALGNRRPVMPRVDELSSRSMLFSHCFSQGPSTRMSFPSIFTSRWDSQQTFEYSSRLPYSFSRQERTLQEAFDDAGYETVAVIPNVYFDRSRWPSLTKGFKRVDHSALSARTGKHNAREVTDAALRVLSEQRDRPLYLWVHYFDAHPPYGAPPGVSPRHTDDRTYYDEELSYIDREFGRLIDAIDERPDPTYLLFTSDHATSFHPVPESRQFHYGFDIYTSTLHVPLLFHGPGLRTGRDDDVVSTMDVAPTLANLFHLNDLGRFEGTSLASELLNGVDDPGRVTFHEYYLPENEFYGGGDPLKLVSARTDQYDLVLNRERGTYELYDWTADYYEQRDLYEDQARSPEVARLRSALGAFIVQASPNQTPPLQSPPWGPLTGGRSISE